MLALANKLSLNTRPVYRFVNEHSVVFDGTDEYINVNTLAGTMFTGQAFSISVWFKATGSVGGHSTIIFSAHNSGGSNIYRLGLKNSGGIFYAAAVSDTVVGSTDYFDSEWHHLVVTRSTGSSTSTFYVDGASIGTIANTNPVWDNATQYSIGQEFDGTQATDEFVGNIDELALYDRELTQAEVTRMYNTYYSPNRITNGNFAQEGVEEVTNGDFSQIGSEEITNGTFATDSNWGKGTGWSINTTSKIAECDGSQSAGTQLTQTGISFTNTKTYRVTYTITVTSGSIKAAFRGGTGLDGASRTSSGTYTENLVALSGNNSFRMIANTDFIGTVDNISVKEVGQEWSFGDGWGMGDGIATCDGTQSSASYLLQNLVLPTPNQYLVTFEVSNYASGNVKFGFSSSTTSPFGTARTANGVYTETFTHDSNTIALRFRASDDFVGDIDNISIKQVGQHWNWDSSDTEGAWTTDGTKAICDGTQTGNISFKNTSNSLIQGRTYKITYDISNYVSGEINPHIKGTATGNVSGNGTKTASGVAGSSSDGLNMYAGHDFVADIDNVIVQELKHDATNLMLNAGAYQSANPLITSTKSMEFDGSDDKLVFETPSAFNGLGLNSFDCTLSAWAKFDTIAQYEAIVCLGTFDLEIAPLNATDVGIWVDSSGLSTTYTPTMGKWNHYVATKLGNTYSLYVDGVLIGSDTNSNNATIGTESFIGNNGQNAYFDGQITEVGIYDRCLTSLEVASLYNQGMPTNLLVNRNNYQSGNPTVFNTKQVDFDGADDYLNLGVLPNSFTTAYSLSTWIFTETGTGAHQILSTGQGALSQVYQNGTGLKLQILGGTGYNDVIDADFFDTAYQNTWVHLVLVYNGSTIKAYRNGIEVGSASLSGTLNSITNEANIGRWQGGGELWNGKISQLGLWNSALTADEVSSLYNHGLPIDLTTDQAAYASSANLVGYWRMGSGTLDTYPLIADQTNATLGSELVTNGDFTTDISGWSGSASRGSYAWDNGRAKITNDAADGYPNLYQNPTTVSGKVYKVTATVDIGTATLTEVRVYDGGILGNQQRTTSGTFEFYFTAVGTIPSIHLYLFEAGNTGHYCYFDNVSIKQVQGNPAIMTNQISSDIEQGSPYANVIQNGDFSDGTTGWNFNNSTLDSGGARINNVGLGSTNAYILQNDILVVGKTYKMQFDIVATNGKDLVLEKASNTSLDATTTGSKTIYFTQASTDDIVIKRIVAETDVTIDNITVAEVNTGLQGYWKMGDGTNDEYPVIYDQTNPTLGSELVTNADFANDSNWVKDSGWTIDNGKATNDGTSGQIYQELSLEIGKKYVVRGVIDASADSSLSNTAFQIRYNSNAGSITQLLSSSGQISANTINYLYISFTATETNSLLRVYSADSVSFYNPTVKEVQGNPATMTNQVEGNISNQYPLTKIRNYYRMGDGILDGYPIIQDQTSPNLAHIPTTNLIPYSEDFGNWHTANNVTITQDTTETTDPLGTNKADKILVSSASTPRRVFEVITTVSGSVYTGSVYAKKGTTDTIRFLTTSSIYDVTFDLTNLTITETSGSGTIESVGNGWYRLQATGTSSLTTEVPQIQLSNSASTNEYLYLWGSQFEQQNQATGYLKSDGIAAVRKSSTTNLIPYSEDFSQWTRTGATTISATDLTSPIGTTNATRITGLTGSGGNDLRSFPSNFDSANKDLTFSVYLKGSGTLRLQMSNGVDQSAQEIVTLTSDWKRHQVFKDFNSTSSGSQFHCNIDDSGANATSYDVWGAQLEEQTQAETYAKTTGLPVTIDLFTQNSYGTMTNMSSSDIVEDTP